MPKTSLVKNLDNKEQISLNETSSLKFTDPVDTQSLTEGWSIPSGLLAYNLWYVIKNSNK